MSTEQVLSRALEYPYPRPSWSFIFPCSWPPAPLSRSDETSFLSDSSRTLVLSIGSNAAPSRLLAKFGSAPSTPIPVLAVRVSGLDVVHAATVSEYGSVTATVVPSRGAELSTHATLLDDAQLAAMHMTELGYAFVRVRTDAVRMQSGVSMGADRIVFAYVWQGGPLRAADGRPRALTMIKARDRVWEECGQKEAQEVVKEIVERRGVTEKGESLETFVLRNVEDKKRRKSVMQAVREEWGNGDALHSDGIWELVRLL